MSFERKLFLSFIAFSIATESLFAQREDMAPRLKFWIENMFVQHRYSVEEAATGLEMSEEAVRVKLREMNIEPATPSAPDSKDRIRMAPWAPGRHPRIGFLEGAVNPQRDTKISIFLPWENSGFIVFDLPEAVFSNLGLLYLAHTHIPTIWEDQGIKLPTLDWTVREDGSLQSRRVLPNKIEFGVEVWPRKGSVDYVYWLENGTTQTLTGLRSQLCLLLKNAPDFNAQSGDNKLLIENSAAVRSATGNRWIITACEYSKPWQNAKCPCMHADPTFPDCAPGKRVEVRGSVFFYEGEDVPEEIERRRIEKSLFGLVKTTMPE